MKLQPLALSVNLILKFCQTGLGKANVVTNLANLFGLGSGLRVTLGKIRRCHFEPSDSLVLMGEIDLQRTAVYRQIGLMLRRRLTMSHRNLKVALGVTQFCEKLCLSGL
jgi:hypothetical protein